MSITLEFRDGLPSLLINDASGEAHGYRFKIARLEANRLWSCAFRALETGNEYTVAAYPDGAWSCTCPDATYRGHDQRDEPCCKHVAAGRQLQQLTLCLIGQDEEIQLLLSEARLFFDGCTQPAA